MEGRQKTSHNFSEKFVKLERDGNYLGLLDYSRTQTGIEARYWEVYCLIWMGRTSKGLKKLEEFGSIANDDFWESRYFILTGFTHWGHGTPQALDYYQKGFEISEKIAFKQGIADYYILSGLILIYQDYEKGYSFLDKGFKISSEIDYKLGIFLYHHNVAIDLLSKGELEEGMKHLSSLEKICVKNDMDFYYSSLLSAYYYYYELKGDFDKAILFLEKSHTQSRSSGNVWYEANSLANLAQLYMTKGLLDKSLEYSQKRYEVELKLEHKTRIARTLSAIADVYKEKGELDRAFKSYEHELKIFDEEGLILQSTDAMLNLGIIYFMKGDRFNALVYFTKSYELRMGMNSINLLELPLINLITLLSTDDRQKAKLHLDKFEEISRELNFPSTTSNFNFMKAIYLKSSKRLKDKTQALVLFEELYNDAKEKKLGFMQFIPHIVELLLLEYSTTKENIVLEEIHNYLGEFNSVARKDYRYPAVIRGLMIEAQLSQIEGNFSIGEKKINEAISLAEERNLAALLTELEKFKTEMGQEISKLEEIIDKNVEFAEAMKNSQIISYVKKAQEMLNNSN
ncbi:MAG: tetratricopeptide repeat protein [Candidatus Hodarchaeales archaeon]